MDDDATDYFQKKFVQSGNPLIIHDSSMKVIKLTKHSIDEDKKRAKILYRCYNNVSKVIFFKIYQPLIIFRGHLFIKRPEQEIQSIKYLQFYREYRTTAYQEDTTIHVVSSEHIQEYLEIMRSSYMTGGRYISEHQNQIMASVKGDLICWNDFNPSKI
jgi:hypothetical protein